MFGKKHNYKTKELMSLRKSKLVYLYRLINNKLKLTEIYPNSIDIANILNLHKTTIGR